MKCKDMPEQLVSLLYGELEADEAKRVKDHFKKCSSCRQTYQELQATTNILEKWEDVTPKGHFVFVNEPSSVLNRWKKRFSDLTGWSKLAAGIPALAAICLLFLSLINFRASKDQSGWHFAFSLFPVKERSIDKNQWMEAFGQLQKETLMLTSQMIQDSEIRQKREAALQLTDYAQNIEKQRMQDLRMVGRGMEGLHEFTEGRFNQTSNALNEFIQLTGYTIERK
jgi:hypothetical protein